MWGQMSLVYQYFLEQSRPTEQEAADLHQVSIDQIRAWTVTRAKVPKTVDAMCTYCRTMRPKINPAWAARPKRQAIGCRAARQSFL